MDFKSAFLKEQLFSLSTANRKKSLWSDLAKGLTEPSSGHDLLLLRSITRHICILRKGRPFDTHIGLVVTCATCCS